MARLSRAKAPSYPTFLTQLLAPVPASTEQVDDRRYLRVLHDDQQRRWHHGMTFVHLAKHERNAASARHSIAQRTGHEDARMARYYQAAQMAYWHACDAQMRIPAPGKGALKWKRDTQNFNGGSPDWDAAIAADEKRLCKGEGK